MNLAAAANRMAAAPAPTSGVASQITCSRATYISF